jgi:hypothetical protein
MPSKYRFGYGSMGYKTIFVPTILLDGFVGKGEAKREGKLA